MSFALRLRWVSYRFANLASVDSSSEGVLSGTPLAMALDLTPRLDGPALSGAADKARGGELSRAGPRTVGLQVAFGPLRRVRDRGSLEARTRASVLHSGAASPAPIRPSGGLRCAGVPADAVPQLRLLPRGGPAANDSTGPAAPSPSGSGW